MKEQFSAAAALERGKGTGRAGGTGTVKIEQRGECIEFQKASSSTR